MSGRAISLALLILLGVVLNGCATANPTPAPPPIDVSDVDAPPPAAPEPETTQPVNTPPIDEPVAPRSTPPAPSPPEEEIYEFKSGFHELALWENSDPSAALLSFKKSCAHWKRRKDGDWLNPNLPQYGQFKDWRDSCERAVDNPMDQTSAIAFFQSYFEPVTLRTDNNKDGLLTAYYAPEISVRRNADSVYSEPLLARPKTKAVQKLPRAQINANTSKVLAYGRPIDVFFLQIQGSGRIRFPDGTFYRAAFNGHNSKKYKSIGSVLIARGELHKDKASKQDIENWMAKAGPIKARALMNENPRYIFFRTEHVVGTDGPKGSMGVPLTAMGSLAIDPRYHPYGSLVYLHVKLPQKAGDYKGTASGILLSAQDSGGAIKGPMRGDIYFGAGKEVGDRAGVMKHKAEWTIFLPSALAVRDALVS